MSTQSSNRSGNLSHPNHHLANAGIKANHFIEYNGELWLTARDLSVALGYSDASKVTNLYNRHKKQFEAFTGILNLRTPSGMQDTRIFSEEAIYLITFFANTPIAKKFRIAVAKFLKAQRQHRFQKAIDTHTSNVFAFSDKRSPNYTIENLKKVQGYSCKGLTNREISMLLKVSIDVVYRIKRRAKAMNLWIDSAIIVEVSNAK